MLRDEIYEGCSNAVTNHFSRDGRCDSPGYSAKYGTYSLMNIETNMVFDFQVVHASQAGNSNRMEKYGLEVLLKKKINLNIPITSLTTDRHIQIRPFMKNTHSYPTNLTYGIFLNRSRKSLVNMPNHHQRSH